MLGKRLVLGRVRRVVVVERDLEVGEVLEVDRVHARDEVLRRDPLLAGAEHHGRAVRVVRADIDAVVAAQLLEPDPEVGLKVLDEMADVDVAVCVRERAGYDYSSFLWHFAPLSIMGFFQKRSFSGASSRRRECGCPSCCPSSSDAASPRASSMTRTLTTACPPAEGS